MWTIMIAFALTVMPQEAVDDKTADQAIETFKTAYKAQAEADRVEAVSDLGVSNHPKVLNRLASVLLSSDGPKVRICAAHSIGCFTAHKKQAVTTLLNAYTACAKDPQVQVAILQALADLEDPVALTVIHRAIEDKEPTVVKAALDAAGTLKNAGSIDPLISFLGRTEKAHKTKSASGGSATLPNGLSVNQPKPEDLLRILSDYMEGANTALQKITEQTLNTSAEWQSWWNKNKGTFKPKK